MIKNTFFIILLLAISGCASSRYVNIQTQEPNSVISITKIESLESAGNSTSNPANFTLDALQGKAIKISAKGRASEYFLFPATDRQKFEIKVKQLPNCQMESKDVNRNRPTRLLLKAYQALSSNDYALAKELANKAAEIDSSLAGPHIISGLALMKEGKKEEARLSLSKARTLDPEDKEIDQLLKLVQ